MLEPQELLEDVIAFFQPKLLRGHHVLVTAGPTYEAIDPVRGITNLSSGKMGFAIARAVYEAGADVTLVAGPVHLPAPRGVTRINVDLAINPAHCQQGNPASTTPQATGWIANPDFKPTDSRRFEPCNTATRPVL